jgi:hypothetical protein
VLYMSEPSEFIGSMPSIPERKPLQQTPAQQKPRPGNLGVGIGFFLCAVCLLVFPTYANMDNLSTGIFYGMGFFVLLIAILGLINEVSRRVRKSKPLKAIEAGPGSGVPQRKRRSNGIGVGLFFFLFGAALLAFPGETDTGDLSLKIYGAGLILMLIGIIGIGIGLSRRSRENRLLAAAEARSGSGVQGEQRNTDGFVGYIFIFLLGIYLLAFPQGTSIPALSKGIFYGVGLIMLLLAILGLCNAISRRVAHMVSPGN